MKRIVVVDRDENPYPEDVARIVRVMALHGLECDAAQARKLWELYSDSMAAGWMRLPDEDDLLYAAVEPYFVIEGEL